MDKIRYCKSRKKKQLNKNNITMDNDRLPKTKRNKNKNLKPNFVERINSKIDSRDQ